MISADDLTVMARVRSAFDPHYLCNPGKVLPTPRLCGERPGPYRPHPLEAAGVITGYRATVDARSLGLGVTALIGIQLSDAVDHEDVAGRLKELAEIEDCWFIAGDDSFMVKVRASDVDGLERTIRRLSGTQGVSRTRTTIVLSTKWENRVGELPVSGQA